MQTRDEMKQYNEVFGVVYIGFWETAHQRTPHLRQHVSLSEK